jgi:hypothetical protein
MSCQRSIDWYSGFYDVPLLFSVKARDGYLVFDCEFDDELDDYPDCYQVKLVLTTEQMTGEEQRAALPSAVSIGSIPKVELQFDDTQRASVRLPGVLMQYLMA